MKRRTNERTDELEVPPYGEETTNTSANTTNVRPAETSPIRQEKERFIHFVKVIYRTDLDKNRSELLDWNI